MSAVIDEILKLYGVAEIAGAKSNPVLMEILVKHHPSASDDSTTAWCGIMMAEAFERSGHKELIPDKYLSARSWLKLKGETVLEDAKYGDIVILWRGSPDGWQGHVACYVSRNESNVFLAGGNQGDRVSIVPYAIERILGIRKQP